MSGNEINRRDFLKIMGVTGAGAALAGCDVPSTVTLEEGKEEVVSYLVPEEFVIPGVGVWYASTCNQCPAGCGLVGRVREGRVLKLEGNPDSPLNEGKLCQMGQAGVQAHYNPDRLTKPLVRKNGILADASWDEAMQVLKQHLGTTATVNGERVAWVTDTVSGHQAVLIQAYLQALGSNRHYVQEVVTTAVGQAVNRDMLGEAQPRYRFDQAKMILSFGADFLGASQSPVHFARQYSKFRDTPRGVLVQVEPKMSLTGANADLWLTVRPGTEGVLALGIANVLLAEYKHDASHVPQDVRDLIGRYDMTAVTRITGLQGDRVMKVATWLHQRSPSLVLSGLSAETHEHGYDTAAAAMLLNVILGNVGQTIVSDGDFPFAHLTAKTGSTKDLLAFGDALNQGDLDTVFFYRANPVYSAPSFIKLGDKLAQVPLKVAFSQFSDETTMLADVVLPIYSAMEDWGTHVPSYQAEQGAINVQQPLMEPLYSDTRGFGDVMLDLLKLRAPESYTHYGDYYAYLQEAVAEMPADVKQGITNQQVFWQQILQKGMIPVSRKPGTLTIKVASINIPEYSTNNTYPYHLVPAPRLGLWDGRHANLPWLQEAPDQISKVVWESWAEMHPDTAQKLGVVEGDFIRISSDQGSLEAKVYIYKGIHPDAVAVPMGQGHEEYGRYAKGRGVNPLKILSPVKEAKSGELALYGTRVQVIKADRNEPLVKMGGSDTQMGRRMVGTVTADVYRRTEGGSQNVT